MAKSRDGAALLDGFLDSEKMSPWEFAVRIGASGVTVWRWLNRKRVPGIVSAMQIEKATHGAVPVEAWAKVERAA